MDQQMREAVLRTVGYSDIFDYPLSIDEIWLWMASQGERPITKSEIAKFVENSRDLMTDTKQGYVYLGASGSKTSRNSRRQKLDSSLAKMEIAKLAGRRLAVIPTVEAVLITGSLAMNNADEDSDIDLLVLTSPGCMWVTRLGCVVLMELWGMRRRPGQNDTSSPEEIANKICLNLFMDVNEVRIPLSKRDLYFAHEILQAKPIYNKNSAYQKFISQNSWAKRLLPNAWKKIRSDRNTFGRGKQPRPGSKLEKWLVSLMRIGEPLMFRLQKFYMDRHRSRETVTEKLAMFHPFDYHDWVMQEYAKRLDKLGIGNN